MLAVWERGAFPPQLPSQTWWLGQCDRASEVGKLSQTFRVEHRSVDSLQTVPPALVLRGSDGDDSVRVRGAVNDSPVSLVVDSGATRTILRKDVLGRNHLSEVPGGLADVTGRRTALYGPTEVNLRIGGHSSLQTVYVADELSDPAILGLDFLRTHHCKWILVQNFCRLIMILSPY